MAQNRRRERELARRRFERRRMAEMQRQAERRRRRNRIGAIVSVAVVLVIVIVLAITLPGGSNKSKTGAGSHPTLSTSPTPTPSLSASSPAAPTVPNPTSEVAKATKTCAPVKPNPPAIGEPRVRNVSKVPAHLQVIDLKPGSGAPVKAGDSITVKYVGIGCSSGKFFDASYTDGAQNQQFTFTLGQGSVIPGWDQGLVGMKVGGVRELVIPAKLGYAAHGSPPSIGPNAPLIFVVTLDKVGA